MSPCVPGLSRAIISRSLRSNVAGNRDRAQFKLQAAARTVSLVLATSGIRLIKL
jgi:hypothetical protein